MDLFLLGCPTKTTKTAEEYCNGCKAHNERNDSNRHQPTPKLCDLDLTANSSVDNKPHKNWLSET
jgi:hypothetical protein